MVVSDAHVFPGFLEQYLHNFLSKANNYFSHMLQQKCEANIRRGERLPQPGIKLTTIRLWVQHAHHWATRAGQKMLQTDGQTYRQKDEQADSYYDIIQGSYTPTILKNILCLFLHDLVNLNGTQLLIG